MRSIGKFKRYKLSKGNKAMGMAASQSRLLTLTARMSDLEYKAQGITNSKLRLSVKTEDVARSYSDALNKERLSVLTNVTSSTNTYSDLSYENLCGKDSPLSPAQYGLSTPGGGILVSKEVEANFKAAKANGGLNKFLELSGAGGTITYPTGVTEAKYTEVQGKVDSTSATYLGVDGTGTTSGSKYEAAEALKALDAYGALHVDGTYSSGGVWTRTDTKSEPVTATYKDADIFNYLNKNCGINQPNGSELAYADGSDLNKSISVMFKNITQSATDASKNITSLVNDICADTGDALAHSMAGMSTGTESGKKFSSAIATAKAATLAHYVAATQNPAGSGKANGEDGTNQVNKLNLLVGNTYWVDATQIVKTFLVEFDRACGATTGTENTGTTTRPNSVTTIDTGVKKDVTTEYKSTDATADDELKMKGYTAPDTEKTVKDEYISLRGKYNDAHTKEGTDSLAYSDAQQELRKLGTPTIAQNEYTPYFTSLYNRMLDGYSTVGKDKDENDTLNNPAWIQNQILNHNFTLEKVGSDGNWKKISLSEDTSILKENDDRDMAKAEADYKVATAEIENKDKRFDLELQDIETEHTAIQTEVDSVKKVIDKNIDRTFKNFSA